MALITLQPMPTPTGANATQEAYNDGTKANITELNNFCVGQADVSNTLGDKKIRDIDLTEDSSNVYNSSPTPAVSSYDTNLFIVNFDTVNTGSITVEFSGLTAKTVKKSNGSATLVALESGDIQIGTRYILIYDGTDFQIFGVKDPEYIPLFTTTGSADAYIGTPTPAISLYDNKLFAIQFNIENTAASTINISGLGVKSIVKEISTAVASADLTTDQTYLATYDGTNIVIISGLPVTAGTESTTLIQIDDTDSPYNVAAPSGTHNFYEADCTSGVISFILPATATAGDRFSVLDIAGNCTTNNITVTVASSGTINSLSSIVIGVDLGTTDYSVLCFRWNGTEYNIL